MLTAARDGFDGLRMRRERARTELDLARLAIAEGRDEDVRELVASATAVFAALGATVDELRASGLRPG
jgi:hypothetical protein